MDKVSLGHSLAMGIPGLGDPQRERGDFEQSCFQQDSEARTMRGWMGAVKTRWGPQQAGDRLADAETWE